MTEDKLKQREDEGLPKFSSRSGVTTLPHVAPKGQALLDAAA
jgi:hypothetical protein